MDTNNNPTLERAKFKLKQLQEAYNMLDDIGFKICWAMDFAEFDSIKEAIEPLYSQTSDAQDEIEEEIERVEESIKQYEEDKVLNELRFEEESTLKYCLS